MKKASKIVSLALVLLMLITASVIPTSAADPVVTTGLELVKVTDEDVTVYDTETWEEVAVKADSLTDGDIYKLVVKLSSTRPLQAINIGVTYDATVFAPCWGNEGIKPALGMPTIYGLAVNDENVGGTVSGGMFAAAKPVGQFADTNKYKADGSIYVSGPPAQYKGNGMYSASESSSFKVTDTTGAQRTNIIDTGANTGFKGNVETDGALMFEQKLSPTTQVKLVKAFKATELEPVWEVYFKTAKDAKVDGARFAITAISAGGYIGDADFFDKSVTLQAIPAASALGCEYTVGAPTASSFVQYSKAQIRFAGIGATSTAADYKGTFDVRTVAKISQADFLANFTDETTAKEKITDLGFVYATTANVADFNLDTAKAVAEGKAAEGYVKAPVTYIQHAADGADYIFTCLIENIADADKDQTVNCLGYVCFDGTYYYFDAAATVSFNDLYKAHFPTA